MCVIDSNKKIIFIAIPKTGTTSIEYYLRSFLKDHSKKLGFNKHDTALTIKNKIADFNDYKVFTIIRNPYDWYVSWFAYRKRKGSGYPTNNMSFKRYVNLQPKQELLNYITDRNGVILVENILLYENNIEQSIHSLFKKWNISCPNHFYNLNKSHHRFNKNYREYYDLDTKQKISQLQHNTITYFKYSF
jgi:hypothetical protein